MSNPDSSAVGTINSISAAIGTYNGSRFFVEQIESILSQERYVQELVVSDDGSTDGTLSLAKQTVDEHNSKSDLPLVSIKLLRNEPALGVTKNFEQALASCTGDILFLCDQDDVWQPNKVESILATFERYPDTQLVFSDALMVDERRESLGYSLFDAIELNSAEREAVLHGQAFGVLLRRNVVTGATVAIRRSLLERALPFPREWVHDEWLAVIAAATGEIRFIDEPLIEYRQHGANQIGARKQGLGAKIRKLFLPRRKRNQRLYDRARTLLPRLEMLADTGLVDRSRVEAAQQKLEHETVRINLAKLRIRRIPSILRELKTGRYSLYDYGKKDALRDLVQPDR